MMVPWAGLARPFTSSATEPDTAVELLCCETCGESYPLGTQACPVDGGLLRLRDGVIEPVTVEKYPADGRSLICTRCRNRFARGQRRCPVDGTPLVPTSLLTEDGTRDLRAPAASDPIEAPLDALTLEAPIDSLTTHKQPAKQRPEVEDADAPGPPTPAELPATPWPHQFDPTLDSRPPPPAIAPPSDAGGQLRRLSLAIVGGDPAQKLDSAMVTAKQPIKQSPPTPAVQVADQQPAPPAPAIDANLEPAPSGDRPRPIEGSDGSWRRRMIGIGVGFAVTLVIVVLGFWISGGSPVREGAGEGLADAEVTAGWVQPVVRPLPSGHDGGPDAHRESPYSEQVR